MRVVLANRGRDARRRSRSSLVADRGTRATLARERVTIPPGGRREAEIDVAAPAPTGSPPAASSSRAEGGARCSRTRSRSRSSRPRRRRSAALALEREGGRVTGVRFTLGAFERGDPLGRRHAGSRSPSGSR